MWILRIFIDNAHTRTYANSVEDGLVQLARDKNVTLVGPLTYQPATQTIYHNGNPCGCYYWYQLG